MRLVYTRTSTLGAALIRSMPPWGPWSHCAVEVGDGWVVEALALRGGVVQTTIAELLGRSSAWQRVELDVPDSEAGIRWARDTIGAGYDWFGVLGIPARRRRWGSARRWYCSEHCAEAIHRAGRQILTPGMHGITPTQLAHLTRAAGHRVIGAGSD